MTGLCIFMTLLKVLATPEKIIKIYAKICNFNHTLIERKHKNGSFFPVYGKQNFSHFYCIKIAISLDLLKIY